VGPIAVLHTVEKFVTLLITKTFHSCISRFLYFENGGRHKSFKLRFEFCIFKSSRITHFSLKDRKSFLIRCIA
jgi:hypothetical protein